MTQDTMELLVQQKSWPKKEGNCNGGKTVVKGAFTRLNISGDKHLN